MKTRFYLMLSVAIGLAACTNDESIDKAMVQEEVGLVQYDPNRRSYEEAMEIAQNSIQMLQDDEVDARSVAPVRTLNLDDVKAVRKTVSRADGTVSDNDTLLYIFNFDDNQGFAVVSASRQTDGLIAVTEAGNYDPAVPTGNPGFDMYMKMAEAYVTNEDKVALVEELCDARSTANPWYRPIYDTTYYAKIEPRIKVKWGQEGIIGQYCPNYVSGCANTAAAQIMSYYQYPTTLTLTYSGRDVNSTALNWSTMTDNMHIYTYYLGNYDEADKQIGRLARQLGQLAGSTYHEYSNPENNETSTSISGIRSALQNLGYNVGTITNYNYKLANNVTNPDAGYPLATLLSTGKLIMMGGEKSNNDDGHAWVIDGCYYVKAKYVMQVSYDEGVTWSVYQEQYTYRTCHNHINWGWDGVYNGYFEGSVFNVFSVLQEDSEPIYPLDPEQDLNYCNNIQYFAVWR